MDGIHKSRQNMILNHKRTRRKQETDRKSITQLKKRRRDLTRLLEHSENLPADVRVGHERELASCNQELEAAEEENKRSQMIKKYHMVRFFERKKATRALKKAKQKLAEAQSEEDQKQLEMEVHRREVDLNYTLFYPLNMAYTSLYAGKAKQEEPIRQDNPMWTVVEQEMARGKLQDLREGKLQHQLTEHSKAAADSTNANNHDSSRKRARHAEPERHRKPGLRTVSGPSKARRRHVEEPSTSDREDGVGFFE